MGFRTVVMLSNDFSDRWSKDPKLGEKIQNAMHFAGSTREGLEFYDRIGNYGRVVECVHADVQTLVRLDHYQGFEPLAYWSRSYGPSQPEDAVNLLKEAVDKLGYRLVKKTVKGK